jgi:hypothetical protein
MHKHCRQGRKAPWPAWATPKRLSCKEIGLFRAKYEKLVQTRFWVGIVGF